MTFVRAVGDQWHKAKLSKALQLQLDQPMLLQYLTPSTDLATVTDVAAALVFHQGQPEWLGGDEPSMDSGMVLRSLFESSRLLFVKAVNGGELSEPEQLVMTFAESWVRQAIREQRLAEEDGLMAALIDKISGQLGQLHLQQRNRLRNMV